MLDIATAYNKYAFLGSEFLLWLWWSSEINPDIEIESGKLNLTIGKSIVIENDGNANKSKSKISITGADAGSQEAMIALLDGGSIKEINFDLTIGDDDYSFTIKSDDLSLKSLKCPKTELKNNDDEIEGALLEKIYLNAGVFNFIDMAFTSFIRHKIDNSWDAVIVSGIRSWLEENKQG